MGRIEALRTTSDRSGAFVHAHLPPSCPRSPPPQVNQVELGKATKMVQLKGVDGGAAGGKPGGGVRRGVSMMERSQKTAAANVVKRPGMNRANTMAGGGVNRKATMRTPPNNNRTGSKSPPKNRAGGVRPAAPVRRMQSQPQLAKRSQSPSPVPGRARGGRGGAQGRGQGEEEGRGKGQQAQGEAKEPANQGGAVGEGDQEAY